MSNPIKYTTGSETLALKKGNFYIGTGDVGKGPTNVTGYYNGISPPSGGYTIYLNKASGGPSIYTASNDAQLISLTNYIAGQSYTTVNECLTYFAGQNDKMVLNRDYEGIVTDGLVLNLDAGFTPSYPKNGTTWYDVVGSNNGTLTNGPTFNSSNSGGIVFDGTDDRVSISKTFNNSTGWSFIFALNFNSSQVVAYPRILEPNNSLDHEIERVSLYYRFRWTNVGTIDSSFNYVIPNETHIYCVVDEWDNSSSSNTIKFYRDGSLHSQSIVNSSGTGDMSFQSIMDKSNSSRPLNGTLYYTQIYERSLSSSEVLQNFNAQKSRFGL